MDALTLACAAVVSLLATIAIAYTLTVAVQLLALHWLLSVLVWICGWLAIGYGWQLVGANTAVLFAGRAVATGLRGLKARFA